MERIKLLIAEGTEDFRIALTESLQGAYHLCVCAEGQETLEQLCQFRPDLVILDLMLPGLDGITILERAAQAGVRSVVLATTRFDSAYILDRAAELGVGYIMRKPCDLRATIDRLTDLSQRLDQKLKCRKDSKSWVTATLLALGFSPKLKGFQYLAEGVYQMALDPKQSVTKELYPAVGESEGAGSENVERACRSAIEKAWLRGDTYLWRTYFPEHSGPIPHRPTNTEFLQRLARAMPLADSEDIYQTEGNS